MSETYFWQKIVLCRSCVYCICLSQNYLCQNCLYRSTQAQFTVLYTTQRRAISHLRMHLRSGRDRASRCDNCLCGLDQVVGAIRRVCVYFRDQGWRLQVQLSHRRRACRPRRVREAWRWTRHALLPRLAPGRLARGRLAPGRLARRLMVRRRPAQRADATHAEHAHGARLPG